MCVKLAAQAPSGNITRLRKANLEERVLSRREMNSKKEEKEEEDYQSIKEYQENQDRREGRSKTVLKKFTHALDALRGDCPSVNSFFLYVDSEKQEDVILPLSYVFKDAVFQYMGIQRFKVQNVDTSQIDLPVCLARILQGTSKGIYGML